MINKEPLLIPRDRPLRFWEQSSDVDRDRLASFVAAELYQMSGTLDFLPELLRVPHVEDGFSALRAWVIGQLWTRDYWTIDKLAQQLHAIVEAA